MAFPKYRSLSYRDAWQSDFSREPLDVYQEKETQRQKDLTRTALRQKYGEVPQIPAPGRTFAGTINDAIRGAVERTQARMAEMPSLPDSGKKNSDGGSLWSRVKSGAVKASQVASDLNPVTMPISQALRLGSDVAQGKNPISGQGQELGRRLHTVLQTAAAPREYGVKPAIGEVASVAQGKGVQGYQGARQAGSEVDAAIARRNPLAAAGFQAATDPTTYVGLGGLGALRKAALPIAAGVVGGYGAQKAAPAIEAKTGIPQDLTVLAGSLIAGAGAAGIQAHGAKAYTKTMGPEGSAVRAVGKVAPGFGGSVVENVGGPMKQPDLARVPHADIKERPDLFQARDVPEGMATDPARVKQIVSDFDPNKLEPGLLVRDTSTGDLVVVRGHHRLEAQKQLAGGGKFAKEGTWEVINADLSNPAHVAQLRELAATSNYTTAATNIREDIRTYRTLKETGNASDAIQSKMRKTAQQADDLKHLSEMPSDIIDRLVQEPGLAGTAAEIARARSAYSLTDADVRGLWKRYTELPVIRSALRARLADAGAAMAEQRAKGAGFGGAEWDSTHARILDTIDELGKTREELTAIHKKLVSLDEQLKGFRGDPDLANEAKALRGKLTGRIADAQSRLKLAEGGYAAARKQQFETGLAPAGSAGSGILGPDVQAHPGAQSASGRAGEAPSGGGLAGDARPLLTEPKSRIARAQIGAEAAPEAQGAAMTPQAPAVPAEAPPVAPPRSRIAQQARVADLSAAFNEATGLNKTKPARGYSLPEPTMERAQRVDVLAGAPESRTGKVAPGSPIETMKASDLHGELYRGIPESDAARHQLYRTEGRIKKGSANSAEMQAYYAKKKALTEDLIQHRQALAAITEEPTLMVAKKAGLPLPVQRAARDLDSKIKAGAAQPEETALVTAFREQARKPLWANIQPSAESPGGVPTPAEGVSLPSGRVPNLSGPRAGPPENRPFIEPGQLKPAPVGPVPTPDTRPFTGPGTLQLPPTGARPVESLADRRVRMSARSTAAQAQRLAEMRAAEAGRAAPDLAIRSQHPGESGAGGEPPGKPPVLPRDNSPQGWRAKGLETAVEIFNAPRGFAASVDISGSARQGGMLAVRNPREFVNAFGKQLQAWASEGRTAQIAEARAADPYYGMWKEAKGFEAAPHGGGGMGEETFNTRVFAKLPGFKNSERAYSTFLDELRFQVFKKNVLAAEAKGTPLTTANLNGLADVINHLSGRGTGAALDKYGRATSIPMFAPRFTASRFQVWGDLFHPDPLARSVARQNFGAFVAGGSSLLGLGVLANELGLAPVRVEVNPLSSDFGKLRIGTWTYDVWAGEQQLVRNVSQLVSGHMKPSYAPGKDMAVRGLDRTTVAERYVRSKLTPSSGMLSDWWTGNQQPGQPPLEWSKPGIAGIAGQLFIPMGIKELAFDQNMNPSFRPQALPGLTGIGVNQIPVSPKEGVAQRLFGQGYEALSGAQKSQVNEDPKVVAYEKDAQRGDKLAQVMTPLRGQLDALSQELDAGQISGNQWRDQYHSIQLEIRGARKMVEQQDSKLSPWFDLFDQATKPDGTVDRDKLDVLQADYEAAHPGTQAEVDRVTGTHDNATLRAYRQASKLASEYYNIPAYRGMTVQESERATEVTGMANGLVSNARAQNREHAFQMLADAGLMTEEDAALARAAAKLGGNPERKAFRAANPEFGRFYSDTPMFDTFADGPTYESAASTSSSGGGGRTRYRAAAGQSSRRRYR